MTTTPTALGVDIGGTKIAAALVGGEGLRGEVRAVETHAVAGAAAVLARAIGLVRTLLTEEHDGAPSAVGVAAGGWMDRSTGRVVAATNLLPGWTGTPLRAEFERAVGLPAVALNDVHAMGLAEARLGAGRGHNVCLSVAVGTGIGGAITVNGLLFQGAHGAAGAIGHIQSRAGGPKCSCGRYGCIEADASGPAIARAFAECAGGPSGAATLGDVVDGLTSSDDRLRDCAHRATEEAGVRLGHVLAGVASAIDPDCVIVGGGAALALGQPFLRALQAALSESVLPPIRVLVVPAGLGPAGGVVGAGLAALDVLAAAPQRAEAAT
jgi:glucokinase